jgi:hypothetical protein
MGIAAKRKNTIEKLLKENPNHVVEASGITKDEFEIHKKYFIPENGYEVKPVVDNNGFLIKDTYAFYNYGVGENA